MNIDWSHKWVRLLPKSDYIREGFPCYQTLTAPEISTVECDICGCPKEHEDASKLCPKERIYQYIKLENRQFVRISD